MKEQKPNCKCPLCEKPIWVRVGIYTCYHGLEMYSWTTDETLSVYHIKLGVLCPTCFEKEKNNV